MIVTNTFYNKAFADDVAAFVRQADAIKALASDYDLKLLHIEQLKRKVEQYEAMTGVKSRDLSF